MAKLNRGSVKTNISPNIVVTKKSKDKKFKFIKLNIKLRKGDTEALKKNNIEFVRDSILGGIAIKKSQIIKARMIISERRKR